MSPKQVQALKDLLAERAIICESLTRFRAYYNQFDKSLSNVVALQVRLEKLEPIFEKFDEVQTQIELNSQLPTVDEDQATVRETFESEYVTLVAIARDHIASKIRFTQNVSHAAAPSTSSVSRLTINSDLGYKIPDLPLPTFDGSVENWIRYRDTFKSVVHNREISNIDKFHYLNQTLTGEAARVISSLGISDANYQVAWKSLTDRYEDSNSLIHHHVRALCEHSSVTKESFVELRQLIDDTNSNLRALQTLGEATDQWDTLVLYLVSKKLDTVTKREWEKRQASHKERSKLSHLLDFLENQCKFLQRAQVEKQVTNTTSHAKLGPTNQIKKQHKHFNSHVTTERPPCVACKSAHALYQCPDFLKLSVSQRISLVRENSLCYNCLRSGHGNKECRLRSCKKCSNKHNTLLHLENHRSQEISNVPTPEPRETSQQSSNQIVRLSQDAGDSIEPQVILSTATICIQDDKGNWHECRAFLDNGSQPHLITQDLCKKLNLSTAPVNVTVTGVAPAGISLNERTHIVIKSKFNKYVRTLRCLVTSKITNFVPISARDISNVQIPNHIQLADPIIGKPKIDLLIGAGLFWDLLCVGQIKLRPEGLLLQKTMLGWILAGQLMPNQLKQENRLSCHLITNQQLHDQVGKLWAIEEVNNKKNFDLDSNNKCEKHFSATTTRNSDGKFIVNTLYTDKVNELGNSYQMAKKRLFAVERKLDRDPVLKEGYLKFMKDYEESGDMTEVPQDEHHSSFPTYYLPHHAVMKPKSTTTKIRVVFDGSAKTTTGLSLNDVQCVGPTVQDDILSIILRFRKYKFVLSADVAKMYRQVLIADEQRRLQRILWRTDSANPIKIFQLNTVTYGTAAAPYLATRCLRQLGEDIKDTYPTASRTIIEDFYVDDVLTGSDTLEEAQQLTSELTTTMDSAGLPLRKWASNDNRVFKGIDLSNENRVIETEKDPKTLGLVWDSTTDELRYAVKLPEQERVTKRTVLSVVSTIYDPQGLVGPAIIQGKIFLQGLWTLKLDWNESLPQALHSDWINYRDQLIHLNDIRIPRRVLCDNRTSVQLHGFCDASEKAYGAAIYLRSMDECGKIRGAGFFPKIKKVEI